MKPQSTLSSLRVRTGLQAGGLQGCLGYCAQQNSLCLSNPSIPQSTCQDRAPVCQNACGACAATAF